MYINPKTFKSARISFYKTRNLYLIDRKYSIKNVENIQDYRINSIDTSNKDLPINRR
ncbi:hypothetical protein DCO58_06460 [Helicobacter saguini]|uniref:Uncharacterized protein n=1 Tax=Helicobacter saguini TaxID=1548018 RepID=A0A6B0HYK4_9HELI|nr:hypothetical protein [Helicobacter saguini]MWV62017.1 hypothetical protein [Helicobacter saguini]MWV67308.1 hypothetical protein [Helicobacter saguini]MWV69661.1 hypothetical protein [Helicobacter saguini]MWV73122.1 hypothetical protein [Helicobacter saguini]